MRPEKQRTEPLPAEIPQAVTAPTGAAQHRETRNGAHGGAQSAQWSTDDYADDFAEFVRASPSSYHAAHEVARRLTAAGYTALNEDDPWPNAAEGTMRAVVVRDGAVIAWRANQASPLTPVRILGAHTDSPAFKLKPSPKLRNGGWAQAGVEVYGGPLLNSWLDRDIEFAGRLVTLAGTEHLVRTGPLARIPQLAIHLDREANQGLKLDPQQHTQPVVGLGEADILEVLAERAGVPTHEIAGHDVFTVDSQAPSRLGTHRELFASPRLDNLISVYAGLRALLALDEDILPGQTPCALAAAAGPDARRAPQAHMSVLAAFDHEELGSESRSGASGPFLQEILDRLYGGMRAGPEERARAMASSWCLSSDVGHSVHPNYQEKHDPTHRPLAGGGPILKLNANQRYATDAHGAAMWARACRAAGVTSQDFVSNNRVPCGSTIGPLTATRLGIRTVDVGVPILSMHSARELTHVADLVALGRVVHEFYLGDSEE